MERLRVALIKCSPRFHPAWQILLVVTLMVAIPSPPMPLPVVFQKTSKNLQVPSHAQLARVHNLIVAIKQRALKSQTAQVVVILFVVRDLRSSLTK